MLDGKKELEGQIGIRTNVDKSVLQI
jgi:hypothetical protein